MYAVVEIQGSQFKVEKDQKIFVNRIDAKEGSKVFFDNVLLTDDGNKVQVGKPNISGTSVEAKIIADSQGKELKSQMVDFHSSRPGHDLRYSLSGEKMKNLGWTPSIKLTERIKQVVEWSLKNENWIEL